MFELKTQSSMIDKVKRMLCEGGGNRRETETKKKRKGQWQAMSGMVERREGATATLTPLKL